MRQLRDIGLKSVLSVSFISEKLRMICGRAILPLLMYAKCGMIKQISLIVVVAAKTIKLDLGGMKSTFFGKLIDPVDIGIVDAAMNKCWIRIYYFKADGFRIRNLLKKSLD